MLARRGERKLEPLTQSTPTLPKLNVVPSEESLGVQKMALERSRSSSLVIPDRTDESFPPLLDFFARTTCVPFRGEIARTAVSDLIASHYSPVAGYLRLDSSQVTAGAPCAVEWHRERVAKATETVQEPVPL